MTADQYKRELDRLRMSDSFRQTLIEAMTETETEEKPVKKRIFRTILLAAALCTALVVTAVAASPTLRQRSRRPWAPLGPTAKRWRVSPSPERASRSRWSPP